MQVNVVFFARLKREIGTEQLVFEAVNNATVRDVAEALQAQYPVNLKGCMVAVNETYAKPEQVLQAGDEVAFLPPVAGGADTQVHTEITSESLTLDAAGHFLVRPEYGAQAYFVGTVRSPNKGKAVKWIEYEGFAPLAYKVMQAAAANAQQQFGELRIMIQHRTGKLWPGEASILIGVASPHRRAALEACDFLIEYLKVHIPVWKNEMDDDGEHWVDGQTAHDTI